MNFQQSLNVLTKLLKARDVEPLAMVRSLATTETLPGSGGLSI
jgi:hypothetical protein